MRVHALAARFGFALRLVRCLGFGFGLRHRHVLQRQLEHLVYPSYRNNIQLVLDVFGYFGKVLCIFCRNQDRADPTAMSREQLFLQAADR